jgi:hypothetical protein
VACGLLLGAALVWGVVLWIVRLRYPLSEVDPRLEAGSAGRDDVVGQLTAPSLRALRESVEPSAHQPAASRPARRVPLGPGAPQEGTVRLRMTASAMRSSHVSEKG